MSLKHSLKSAGEELLSPTGTHLNKESCPDKLNKTTHFLGGGPYHVSWQKQGLN